MSQSEETVYISSRLKKALLSPTKAWLYTKILFRFLILFIYYKIRDLMTGESRRFKVARRSQSQDFVDENNPLVSVVIATYNRSNLLKERALNSILSQTYQNFEVLVIGDGCTDDTGEVIASLNDPRIRYYNLNERGSYPTNPKHRWMVAGIPPMNRANLEAKGHWIAHLDDDEIFTPDHIEKLLRFAQAGNYEFVYSIAQHEYNPGEWINVGNIPLMRYLHMNYCGHSSAMWRNYLNVFEYDINAWRMNVPGDQHRWARLILAGVRIGFLPEITAIAPLRPGATLYGHLSQDRS